MNFICESSNDILIDYDLLICESSATFLNVQSTSPCKEDFEEICGSINEELFCCDINCSLKFYDEFELDEYLHSTNDDVLKIYELTNRDMKYMGVIIRDKELDDSELFWNGVVIQERSLDDEEVEERSHFLNDVPGVDSDSDSDEQVQRQNSNHI